MEKRELEARTVEEQMKAMNYMGMFIVYDEYTEYPMAIKKIGEDQYSKIPFNWEEDYNRVRLCWNAGEIISYVEVYSILLESAKKNSYHKILADYYLTKKKIEEKESENELIKELKEGLEKTLESFKTKTKTSEEEDYNE